MKKILLIVLLLLLNTSYAEFSDLPQEHWSYNAVNKMKEVGILSGYPDGTFKPDKNITLGEFATIFSNFFNIPTGINNDFFSDIPNEHWAKNKVEAIRKYIEPNYNSIAETFEFYDYFNESGINADMPVTREVVIYAFCNIFGYDDSIYNEGEEKTLFTDYEEIIYPNITTIAYKKGIISGEKIYDKVYIRPQRYITRAEISAIFNNLLGTNETLENQEEVENLKKVIDETLELIGKKKFNEVKDNLYDTANILKDVDFTKVFNDDFEKILKMWHENFTYDIRKIGFYSYNHAYLNVDTYEIDLSKIIDDFEVSYKDLTTEKLAEKIQNYNFKSIERFYRIGNTRIIEFIKVNGEWKIKL